MFTNKYADGNIILNDLKEFADQLNKVRLNLIKNPSNKLTREDLRELEIKKDNLNFLLKKDFKELNYIDLLNDLNRYHTNINNLWCEVTKQNSRNNKRGA